MRTILHPDYWVEVPAGECLLGLSEQQCLALWLTIRDQSGYAQRSPDEQRQMDAVIDKLRRHEVVGYVDWHPLFQIPLPALWRIPQRTVWLDRFYIARYPISSRQFEHFSRLGTPVERIPAVLEEPEGFISDRGNFIHTRCAATVHDIQLALDMCKQLGGRLPRRDEWEKAARGTDGRLYPWGSEWDEKHGYFYRGQPNSIRCLNDTPPVDAYPSNVSPYGVMAMVGGLPELVIDPPVSYRRVWEIDGEQVSIDIKGHHPKDSSAETAYLNHIVALYGSGDWVSFRPVLDEWPKQLY